MKEKQKSNWKFFGKDTWLAQIERHTFWRWAEGGREAERKYAFIHSPCTKSNWIAFGESYGIYTMEDPMVCNKCGNVLPQEAREGEGYVKLMNAVKNYT